MILADATAYDAGRTTGQLLLAFIMLLGILKCWTISRRPTTNAKCVLALMLLLLGWLMAAVASLLLGRNPALRVVYGLLGLAMLGLIVAALVLAILGLAEYANARERYAQGRAQAIWALVLCGLFGCFAVAGVLRGAMRSAVSSRQPAAGTRLEFQDVNFRFTAPGRPWAQAEAKKLSPYAKLAFLRGSPEMYFMVTADPCLDADCATERLVEMSATRMQTLSDNFRPVSRAPLRVGGLDGLRVENQTEQRALEIHYVHWFCATNGWAYHLMAWGNVQHRQAITEEAGRLLQRFEMIDYARHPPLIGKPTVADFVSTNFPYVVRCGTPDWLGWDKIDTECQYASFGVLHRQDAALEVTAVQLPASQPRPELVYRGLLEMMGFGQSAADLSNAREIHGKHLVGIEIKLHRTTESGTEFSYQIKVLQGGGFAFLVAAWVDSRHEQTEKFLADAVSRVEFLEPPASAPDLALLSEREKRAERLACNQIGLVAYREGQYDLASQFFKVAVGQGGPLKTTPYLANLTEALINAGKYREALDELERNGDFVTAQPALQAQRSFLEGRVGQVAQAVTNYARLFATGFSAEDHFREYVGLLAMEHQPEKALAEIEAFVKKQDSPGVRVLQANLLKEQKKFPEAIALLKAQRERNRFHVGVVYALGDAFILSGQPIEALALSQEAMKQQGPSATLWYLKGRAEFTLKWYREAKESLEHARKESPSDANVKEYLNAVSSVLGEGAYATVQEVIAPVPLPAELTALPATPAADYGWEDGAYYVRRLTAVSFERGKELKSTDYTTVKTLSPTGVSAFSTFQIAFNPLNEELHVNRLEVRDAAGSLVSTGRVADSYVLDDRTAASANSRKVLNIPVSGLQPGCTIELVCTRRELGEAKEFTFLHFGFSRGMPVQESVLYVTGETAGVRYASSPRMNAETAGHGLCWRQKNPPVVRWEALLPTLADYVPTVWVGDATAKWSDLVTNYLHSIKDRLDLPAEQRAVARKLTATATNQAQKVSAIADYVQTNFTYKAIEFGRRARVPQSLGDIVRNKYGDCKDHAILAQQMLEAVSVPATLALVHFSSPPRPDLPSLDQFDHMLVYIPGPGGDSFLDCTAKNASLSAPWSLGLAGREALILDAKNPHFVRLPEYPTNASTIRATRSVDLTNHTDALVREKLVFNGAHAGYVREYLRNQLPEGRRSYVASFLRDTIGQLLELTFDGLDQPQLPLAMQFTYLARGQFHVLDGQIFGQPPAGFERAFLIHEAVEKRSSPFEVTTPLTIEGSVTVNLPAGFKPRAPGEPEAKTGNAFVNSHAETHAAQHGWQLNYRLFEPAGRFAALEYAGYCRAMQQALETVQPRLVGEPARP